MNNIPSVNPETELLKQNESLRARLAESECRRHTLTQQNAELQSKLDIVAIELEKGTQQLIALYEMKNPGVWGPYALRNGQLHIQCLTERRARKGAEAENLRKDKRIANLVDRAGTYHAMAISEDAVGERPTWEEVGRLTQEVAQLKEKIAQTEAQRNALHQACRALLAGDLSAYNLMREALKEGV